MPGTDLTALWLPIIVAAVAVFFASFLAWMVLPHHKPEIRKFPAEDELLELIRTTKPEPGPLYMFPFCADFKEMEKPEVLKRWTAGPHGLLYAWAGPPSLARNLPLMFVFYLVVGVFVAYLAGMALAPGAEFMTVFRFTGTAAVMAFALGTVPNTVWFTKNTRAFLTNLADDIVYGIITGLVFAWLWPSGASPADLIG